MQEEERIFHYKFEISYNLKISHATRSHIIGGSVLFCKDLWSPRLRLDNWRQSRESPPSLIQEQTKGLVKVKSGEEW